jgi:ribosomal protein S18 acetylase RimI-like enzyme
MEIKTRTISTDDARWLKSVFKRRWGGDFMVSRGKIHKPESLDGFIAEVYGKNKGAITYKITGKQMEIVSLDSFLRRKGIGAALLGKAVDLARKKRLKRVWLVTTNDNLGALKFYQKRGFTIARIYPDAVRFARKVKPSIPLIGREGIPLRDEIELEKEI